MDTFKLNAQRIALDLNNTAVSDHPMRFGHQLKTDWNMGWVRHLNRGPFGGYTGNVQRVLEPICEM